MQKTNIQFIDNAIRSWSGVSILKKLLDQSGIVDYLRD
jgi:hypothetical protein